MPRFTSAPKYKNGLVIPPQELDCVGETCHITEKLGFCKPDEHHLYFPLKSYVRRGGIYERLYKDPHARITLARCQHDNYHRQWGRVDLPNTTIVERFLKESEMLTYLGVHVSNLGKTIRRYRSAMHVLEQEDIRPDTAGLYVRQGQSAVRWAGRYDEILHAQIETVLDSISLIPEPVVLGGIAEVLKKREQLIQTAPLELALTQ